MAFETLDLFEFYKYIIPINICEFVVGLVGNVIACIVILCSRSMRSLVDFYLLSLSISDLLILSTGVFYDIINPEDTITNDNILLFYTRDWIFETSVISSILTVTAFTIERYLAICHPFFIQSMANTSRAKKIITIIWSIAAVLALLPVAERFLINTTMLDNTFLFHLILDAYPCTLYIRVSVYFVLPILLITVMYTLIGIELMKSSNERRTAAASQANHVDKKTLMMCVAIIVAFFISWAPFYLSQIMIYQTDFDSGYLYKETQYVFLLKGWTYSLSSVLNPIIYGIMSKKFREAFKRLLSKSRIKLTDWSTTVTNAETNEVSLEMSDK